jgi:hypothetical protein
MHKNREISSTPWSDDQGRSAKATSRKVDMYVPEKSDCAVVPMNQPNIGRATFRGGQRGKGTDEDDSAGLPSWNQVARPSPKVSVADCLNFYDRMRWIWISVLPAKLADPKRVASANELRGRIDAGRRSSGSSEPSQLLVSTSSLSSSSRQSTLLRFSPARPRCPPPPRSSALPSQASR